MTDLSDSSTENNPPPITSLINLGLHLRWHRLQQRMTLAKAAAYSSADVDVLRALEEGEPDRFDDRDQVRDTYRRYVRLLDLDEMAYMVHYRQLEPPPKPVTNEAQQRWPVRSMLIGGSLALLAVIAVVALAWLLDKPAELSATALKTSTVEQPAKQATPSTNPNATAANEASAATAQVATASEATTNSTDAKPMATTTAKPGSTQGGASNADKTTIVQSFPPSTDEPSPSPPPTPENNPTMDTANPDATQQSTPLAQQPVSADNNSSAAETNPVPADNTKLNTVTLRLHFTASCWLEVTDGRGERLAYELVEAPGEQTLRGQPPFTITLGNSQAVTIYWNNQAIDPSRYQTPELVSRFQLTKP